MAVTGRLHKASSENGIDLEWSISNFSNLNIMDSYACPSFFFEGEYWQLVILFVYCEEDEAGHFMNYIDLGLHRCNTGPPISLEFCLSLKTVTGEKYLEQHVVKTINNSMFFSKTIFHKYLHEFELLTRQSELLPSDVLTFVCTLKKVTSQRNASEHTTAECSFCKKTFDAVNLLSHENECTERPIKCPKCSEVILLQDRHECQPEEAEGETCANLHRDFKELFIKQEDTDVIINVKGHEFLAHRIILKSRSPVFASIFRHKMKENATGTVDIEDCDAESFSDFLCFLYCGDVEIVSHEKAFGLFFAADKYEILDLRAKCLEFIANNLSVEMFCDTLTLALRHTETKLIELSTDFFIKNAEEILNTVKWQTFADENSTQSNELFLKYVESVKQSMHESLCSCTDVK